jgi:perosamine synthetase
MPAITELALRRRWAVVEDMSELHGLLPYSDTEAACWSFYQNKIVHGEEGGIVTFNNPEYARLARMLRCQGFTEEHDFLHIPRGHNYRLSNANASLILASFTDMERNLTERRRVEQLYEDRIPDEWKMPSRDACWVYDMRLRGIPNVGEVVHRLNYQGIAARHSFKPMSMQPEYLGDYQHLNAYRLSTEVLYLPITPEMTQEQVRHNVNWLMRAVDQAN